MSSVKFFALLCLAALPALADDFILIRGGALPGKTAIRVDDFEMLDHPIVNSEYKQFTDATGYVPPLHWETGRIPAGMENLPVIFVNRKDAAAYLKWRSDKEGRRYRLPTVAEFEYAARAGAAAAKYPWGKDAPAGKANFDSAGDRSMNEWRRYLKPVKSYPPNPWKLYDMAGNVWQMLTAESDNAEKRYIYRLESPTDKENTVGGGSWARGEYYLQCSVHGGTPSGMRMPDLGFRPVREPLGATSFERQPRRVVAANAGEGRVYVGWQFLEKDAKATAFHVYRASRRDGAGERITVEPVRDSTNFLDPAPPQNSRLYYRVRSVGADGKEGPPSEWAAVRTGGERSGLIATFEPTVKEGAYSPVFGDLDGDGVLDLVVRLGNGISEMSRDPGVPVELEAYTNFGRALWRRPLGRHDHCYGNANNLPVVVYDLDGDGKSEVICRLQDGDDMFVAILDGMTGRVRRKTPWTPMATDHAGTSTRIHMSIAFLNGKTPSIITQTGLYENEIFDAFDGELKKQWTFKSFAETNGSGSHRLVTADVDDDGRDEVFDGSTLLNPDGKVRWSIYRQHPDHVAVHYMQPDAKVRQEFFAVETSTHAGAYMADARSGKIAWKVNREDDPRWNHAHIAWVSDIWDGSPGLEIMTNRDGHEANDVVLFSAAGKLLTESFSRNWYPVNWTGGTTRELMSSDGKRLARFNGKEPAPLNLSPPNEGEKGSCGMVADLAGDYRDEVVCIGKNTAGGQAIYVYTNVDPVARRELTRTSSREYRNWLARNISGGYASYFEYQPGH